MKNNAYVINKMKQASIYELLEWRDVIKMMLDLEKELGKHDRDGYDPEATLKFLDAEIISKGGFVNGTQYRN